MATTDYTPGDPPVPVDTVVDYTGSMQHGRFFIREHQVPIGNPKVDPDVHDVDALYPDGVAYYLWPVGLEFKFGNRDHAVYYARRTSFSIAPTDTTG